MGDASRSAPLSHDADFASRVGQKHYLAGRIVGLEDIAGQARGRYYRHELPDPVGHALVDNRYAEPDGGIGPDDAGDQLFSFYLVGEFHQGAHAPLASHLLSQGHDLLLQLSHTFSKRLVLHPVHEEVGNHVSGILAAVLCAF